MNHEQLLLAFFDGDDQDPVARYAIEHPELESEIVRIMRELAHQGLAPSVHSAFIRLRERGVAVWDGAKAFYGRSIKAKYPDLARFIRIAQSRLDKPCRQP